MPPFTSFFRRRPKAPLPASASSALDQPNLPLASSSSKVFSHSKDYEKSTNRRRRIWHKAKASLNMSSLKSLPPVVSQDQSDRDKAASLTPSVSRTRTGSNSSYSSVRTLGIGSIMEAEEDIEEMHYGDHDQFLSTGSSIRKSSFRSRWKGGREAGKTALSTVKYGLQALKESTDAFPPLKSVSGGLLFILSTYEQWISNKEDVKRLLRRINLLQAKFDEDSDISNDTGEMQRRNELTINLKIVLQTLDEIEERNGLRSFVESEDKARTISGLVEDIRDAILEYQVSLQMSMHKQNNRQIALGEMRDLQMLPRARNASSLSEHHQTCLKGTRVEVLQVIENWADDEEALRVYWLNGHAGSGKSTIAQSLSKQMFAEKKLGATFFCSRDFVDRSDLHFIFPTISFQLACQFTAFRAHIVDALRTRPDIGSESLTNQLVELIIEPLEATKLSTLIVIDALDECKDDSPTSALLSLLSRYIHRIPLVKWFITSRPEATIRSGFRQAALQPLTKIFVLHDVKQSSVEHDIELYFRTRLAQYAKERSNLDIVLPWPSDEDVKLLVKKADGLFIFARTALTFITSPDRLPDKQLSLIAYSPNINIYEGQSGLDILYSTILQNSYGSADYDPKHFADLRTVWGCLVIAFNPLSRAGLSTLLVKSSSEISTSLRMQHAVLQVPKSATEPIRIYHKSFPEYLADSSRCTDQRFFINAEYHHTQMAIKCLTLMNSALKRNICGLPPFSMNNASRIVHRREKVGEGLEYACRFWVQHLVHSSGSLSPGIKDDILALIRVFMIYKQVFWFEVMSLVEDLHSSVHSLNDLMTWIQPLVIDTDILLQLTSESKQFILQFFDCVQESALHLYHSALAQIPVTSQMRKFVYPYLGSDIVFHKGLELNWKAETRNIITRLNAVTSIKFSSDGSKICATGDRGIQIFDSATGECLATMPTPSKCLSVEFSHDDSCLISADSDNGIRLWDVQTGGFIRVCEAHQSIIHDISVSPNGHHFASVDQQGVVLIWNAHTGNLDHTFQIAPITARVFCKWLSATRLITHLTPLGGTSVHDIVRGKSENLIPPERKGISVLSVTRHGLRIVERERSRLRIFDASTLQLITSVNDVLFPLQLAKQKEWNSTFHFMSMSMDERHLALLKSPTELCLYRLSSPERTVSTSIYHLADITWFTFSPNSSHIAVGSKDGTVNIWSVDTKFEDSLPATAITSVCVSAKGEYCAYASKKGTIEVYDILKGAVHRSTSATGTWKGAIIEKMVFSPRNDFLAIHYKKTVCIDGLKITATLGLVLWDFGSDVQYPQVPMVIPNSIDSQCNLEYFEGYPDMDSEFISLMAVLDVTDEKRIHLDHTFLLHVLYLDNRINFQVWRMTPLGCWWNSAMQNTSIVPRWPLSIHISKPEILVYYTDHKLESQVWKVTFDRHNTGFTLSASSPLDCSTLNASRERVLGNNWILNEQNKRILWVPYEVALPTSEWQERACWLGRTLILGGREGDVMVVEFTSSAGRPTVTQELTTSANGADLQVKPQLVWSEGVVDFL